MKKLWLIGLLVIVVVSLTGCAAGPNVFVNQSNPDGEVAGFWQGLWHGLIVFITFIISLFNDNVRPYVRRIIEAHGLEEWKAVLLTNEQIQIPISIEIC